VGKKKAIIITDGSELIQAIALSIKDSLSSVKTKIISVEKFAGNDILPADIFILGCEKPNPASFAYLEDLLSHINLASRKCCIFSTSEKTIKYLKGIVKTCEADLAQPYLTVKDKFKKSDVKSWLKGK
jgi:hypothetical protein